MNSRIHGVELRVRRRQLIGHAETGSERFDLGSIQRLGLFSLLIDTRLRGHRDGWVSAVEIVAAAPGWQGRTPSAVGKRIFDSLAASPLAHDVVSCPGGATVGPWRIALPPARITVADPSALQELLRENSSVRMHTPPPSQPAVDLSSELLDELDRLVNGGVVGAAPGALLQPFLRVGDTVLRARASRIEAGRLRRRGRLRAAAWYASNALNVFADEARMLAVDLAAARHEQAVIHYHLGKMEEALQGLGDELDALRRIDERKVRASGITRNCRFVAFTLLRKGDLSGARAAAEEALIYAAESGDKVEAVLAQLASLRVMTYCGQARLAAQRLADVASITSVVHPASVLMARRFHAEAAFAIRETDLGDSLAVSVFSDAHRLGMAREADAAAGLLRNYERHRALEGLPAQARALKRDRLNDLLLVATASENAH